MRVIVFILFLSSLHLQAEEKHPTRLYMSLWQFTNNSLCLGVNQSLGKKKQFSLESDVTIFRPPTGSQTLQFPSYENYFIQNSLSLKFGLRTFEHKRFSHSVYLGAARSSFKTQIIIFDVTTLRQSQSGTMLNTFLENALRFDISKRFMVSQNIYLKLANKISYEHNNATSERINKYCFYPSFTCEETFFPFVDFKLYFKL